MSNDFATKTVQGRSNTVATSLKSWKKMLTQSSLPVKKYYRNKGEKTFSDAQS